MESIEGKLYWTEEHPSQGIIIADVNYKNKFGMFEVKIQKLLFSSGGFKEGKWGKGFSTTVIRTDLKDQKDTIKFVFDRI